MKGVNNDTGKGEGRFISTEQSLQRRFSICRKKLTCL